VDCYDDTAENIQKSMADESPSSNKESAGTIDLNWVMLIIAYTLIIHDEWSRILQLIFGSFESLQLSAVRIGRFINWATPKANLL
jgi:hypothetical protein